MMNRLNRSFYLQPTLEVAQELLGKFLVHKIGKKKLIGKIIETETYIGPKDKASHASRGRTPRTELMFGEAGHAYVYLIYGMYYCFNVVTGKKDYPAAVLIRAVQPFTAGENGHFYLHKDVTNGPGKLCRYLKIDKKLNGVDLTSNVLWIEDRGIIVKKSQIGRAKRIGVDYAGEYKDKLWRFYIIST
ncbi:MAG: 3-methyladenine DNA glycosylase [Candidatus Kerfeldbacteria bacterium CG08_land_8_20_14_0_20_40_16]|uniref:Putative 3-methyladenine DNA glycosylase n=1 Tax=Candidatus Kerfeldbacteria bacterium CG08_land_8_20_14_0_20_40_16 TaxID=2014244 RepID=A0A2H0YUW7_9BACT|nr:MAG: 3-methyladenine DNA glycosylase [Candidatus Kerfeldbacteria bacterium CG08_land_8_20_14_0_20_40_16]